MYNYEVQQVIKAGKYTGVIPPTLQPDYMTKHLTSQQKNRQKNMDFGKRLQLYDDDTVHDVGKAMEFLRSQLIGFFVEAPLDWGAKVKVEDDPSKESFLKIDLTMMPTEIGELGNGAVT